MYRPGLRFCAILSVMALSVALVWAQSRLTVDQLRSFIQSSVKLKHPDRQVANYLLKQKLAERLDLATVEELQGLGAGPDTVAALRKLSEGSASLAAAPPKQEKVVLALPAPPSAEEQKAVIEQAREYALSYTNSLPNFLCTQVTRRYYDPTGLEFWQMQDTLMTRLSYFEQKESYQLVMVNNHSTTQSYESLGGATSTGEFGSILKELFDPTTEATFQWLRWATLRAKRAHVYAYRVQQSHSQWHLSYERSQEIIIGYSGLVYVDRDTGMILKVTLEAEDIPPSFPIGKANSAIDYDFTKIGDQTHLLPLKAEVRMRSAKMLSRNLVEFRLYRKFGADTTITFDTPEALPEDVTKEQAPK